MADNAFFLRFVREYFGLILFGIFAATLIGAWIVFEAARTLMRRDDYEVLRRRVEELEREHAALLSPRPVLHATRDPLVLPPRWIVKGAAATTSDGGCLVLVDDVMPDAAHALITLRVDGLPVKRRHALNAGDVFELGGRLGTYTVQLVAVAGIRAQLAAWLRSRHQEHEDDAPAA